MIRRWLVPLALASAHPAAGATCNAIIDVHLHAYGQDGRLQGRALNPATGKPSAATDGQSHRRLTLSEARRLNVVRGIVSGDDHAAVDAMIAADPARFKRGIEFDHVPSPSELAELRALATAGKLTMIGEIAPQYAGAKPSDPGLEPLWAMAEEFDLPVGYHMGSGPAEITLHGSPQHRAAIGDPLLMEEVIVRHPKLRLFIMHAGYPFRDSIHALLNSYPNVYVALGAIHWWEHRPAFHAYLKRLIEDGFVDRIMFGSDQMTWPEAIGESIAAYREADYLTEAQRRAILYDNAVRFFRWTDLPRCSG